MTPREIAEFVHGVLKTYPLHTDLTSATLIDKMLSAPPGTDPWSLDLSDQERRILGRSLAENPAPPTFDESRSALAWLGRRRLIRQAERLSRELRSAEARNETKTSEDPTALTDLLLAKRLVRRSSSLLEDVNVDDH